MATIKTFLLLYLGVLEFAGLFFICGFIEKKLGKSKIATLLMIVLLLVTAGAEVYVDDISYRLRIGREQAQYKEVYDDLCSRIREEYAYVIAAFESVPDPSTVSPEEYYWIFDELENTRHQAFEFDSYLRELSK